MTPQEQQELDRAWRELQAARGMYDSWGTYSQLRRLEATEARYEELAAKHLVPA